MQIVRAGRVAGMSRRIRALTHGRERGPAPAPWLGPPTEAGASAGSGSKTKQTNETAAFARGGWRQGRIPHSREFLSLLPPSSVAPMPRGRCAQHFQEPARRTVCASVPPPGEPSRLGRSGDPADVSPWPSSPTTCQFETGPSPTVPGWQLPRILTAQPRGSALGWGWAPTLRGFPEGRWVLRLRASTFYTLTWTAQGPWQHGNLFLYKDSLTWNTIKIVYP